MKSKYLKIEFQSDWHIGSGAGIPGSVDRQVLRDSQGLPYVPGKTLTGIIRDAAEFVAAIRGEKNLPSQLFGNQPETHGGESNTEANGAKIGIGSAVFPKSVSDYILAHDLTSALFYVQPGVKIDPETGCSEKEHLFSIEKARRGCILYAEVIFMQELSGEEQKLLNDALKAVRRIGGKRRRGAGLCRLSWCPDVAENEISSPDSLNLINFKCEDSAPLTLKIRLQNLQPLIIASKTVGNAIQSETKIPGYMLLSYYANKILAPLGQGRVQRAVMNNEIILSNFLPELEGSEVLPVPLCIAKKKESEELVNRLLNEPEGTEQLKDIRTGYIRVLPGEVKYYTAGIRKIVRTHNTVEDSSQRPDETTGGLFTYEALESGQKFTGTLTIKKSLLDDIMQLQPDSRKNILSGLSRDIHKIGRSRKDEYGKVMLEFVSSKVTAESDSVKLLDGRTQKSNGKYLVVYLKSDLLLKDSYNSYTTRIDDVKKALCEKLGVTLEDIPESEWTETDNSNISPIGGTRGHCIRIGRRDSWQTAWTLPRPSLIYFREGSIFMFKVADPENWNAEKAKSLIQNGLGERIAEGYGQILINPCFICNPDVKLSRSEKENYSAGENIKVLAALPVPYVINGEEIKIFLDTLQKDSIRRRFRQIARCEAYIIIRECSDSPFDNYPGVSCSKNKRPSASQFGALREAVSGGHNIFTKWVSLINRENGDQNTWDSSWRNMLSDLAEDPGSFVNLRPAFSDFGTDNPDESKELLAVFLDILCEAVFDDEKEHERSCGQ